MKNSIILCFLLCIFYQITSAQSTIAFESFEGTTGEHGYTTDPAHQTSCPGSGITTRVWERTDDSGCIAPTISGMDGSYYWVAENVDNLSGTDGTLHPLAAITLDVIDISGYTDLEIRILAGQGMSGYFESGDYLQIQYATDLDISSSTYTTAAQFIPDAGVDANLAYDANADGTIDGATLITTLNDFIADLGNITGDSIAVRLLYNSNSFSEEIIVDHIRLIGTSTPLPAELTDFQATQNEAGVEVQWQTASEEAILGFDVEKKGRGESWTNITNLTAKGARTYGADYHFIDQQTSPGWQYYRLRINEMDGSFSYSPLRSVYVESDDVVTLAPIFPNPVDGGAVLQIPVNVTKRAEVQLRIYHAGVGSIVAQEAYELEKGAQVLQLHTSGWAGGIYLVELEHEGRSYFEKLVVY